jgi:prepilin-type processing-associated H-X9-DG protein
VIPASYAVDSNGVDHTDPNNPVVTGNGLVTMLTDTSDPSNLYLCLFGSAHSGGIVNFVFCDGHTGSISSGIDPLTHRYLGERNDGKILDDAVIGQ